MKKLFIILSLFLPLLVRAQSVSNVVVAPYATHTEHGDWGGGILIAYNINDYVGAVAALDDVDRLQLVSGGIQLRKTFDVWGFPITPFAIAAMGTPAGGADNQNGNLSTVTAAGINVDLFQYKGWQLGVGAAYANWTNAGKESGPCEEMFIKLGRGF